MFSLIKAFDWWDMKPADPSKMFKDLKHKRTEETGENEDYAWKSEEWSSEDGTAKFTRKVYTSKPREKSEDLKTGRTEVRGRHQDQGQNEREKAGLNPCFFINSIGLFLHPNYQERRYHRPL